MNLHRAGVGVFRLFGLIPSLIAILFASELRPAPAADNVVPLASTGTLAISDVTLSKSEVPRFETVEYTFPMAGQWENPFDPEEVRVDAVVTGEDGARTVVPAFFYQEYRLSAADGRESYQPVGDPCWKVRFAPPKPAAAR